MRELCAVNAVVIELDDIHHADDASLDLLTALVGEEPDLPLLAIYLARPSLFRRRRAWGSGQEAHIRLELRPLGRSRGSQQHGGAAGDGAVPAGAARNHASTPTTNVSSPLRSASPCRLRQLPRLRRCSTMVSGSRPS